MHSAIAVLVQRFGFALFLAGTAGAQCLEYTPGFDPPGGGLSGGAFAQIVFDDGTGPALYMAGVFRSAGSLPANNIARWDGANWSALGSGLDGPVYALAVFDDGSGPALYAGGSFSNAGGVLASRIAKWDGTQWSGLGPGLIGPYVLALAAYDDGTGPALYAGGWINGTENLSLNEIGRWDGRTWSAVGAGSPVSLVYALLVHDDGSGSRLYAAGDYGVQRWDGTSWNQFGGSFAGIADSLAEFDDGGGLALYVSGGFVQAGGTPVHSIAKWDGHSWSPLGNGIASTNQFPNVARMAVYDDGGGPRLFTYGFFVTGGGQTEFKLGAWDGANWALYDGVLSYGIYSLCAFQSRLYVSANVELSDSTFGMGVVQWDGAHWLAMQSGSFQGLSGAVYALGTFDDGSGRSLYAGGNLTGAGTAISRGLVRWDGASWHDVGRGVQGFVYALAEFDDGSGPALYVGGTFDSAGGLPAENIARWDGSAWSAVGSGFVSEVDALAVYDDGSGAKLYAAGKFPSGIMVWDPAHDWSLPAAGGLDHWGESLCVHDDGGGPALYVGGRFVSPAQDIARLNASGWSALGCGIGYPNYNNHVWAMTSFDFGAGPELVAGGLFTVAGCANTSNVVRWNGTGWSSMPYPGGNVKCLASFDDGNGPALYVGGVFTPGILRWNGHAWAPVGQGSAQDVYAMTAFDSLAAGGPDLFLAGSVSSDAGFSTGISAWRGCAGPGSGFCFGDGSSTACPCANSGLARHGCENSATTGGAVLTGTGQTRPDTVILTATGELSHSFSLFVQSRQSVGPFRYGDGLRCTGGGFKRLYAKNASGGVVSAPGPGDLSISDRSAALGDPLLPGSTRYYQTYYRDPSTTFCPPSSGGGTFNATSGYRIVW